MLAKGELCRSTTIQYAPYMLEVNIIFAILCVSLLALQLLINLKFFVHRFICTIIFLVLLRWMLQKEHRPADRMFVNKPPLCSIYFFTRALCKRCREHIFNLSRGVREK